VQNTVIEDVYGIHTNAVLFSGNKFKVHTLLVIYNSSLFITPSLIFSAIAFPMEFSLL